MARLCEGRIILKGILTTQTPLAIGGAADGVAVDIAVARDGSSRLYIPGTAIAGALRKHFCATKEDALWGGTEDGQGASRIAIDDAPLKISDAQPSDEEHDKANRSGGVELRDGIKIDGATGAAEHGYKFNREIVPAGSRFEFSVQREVESGARSGALAQLDVIKATLEAGDVFLGGGTSRGFGRIILEDAKYEEVPLSSKSGFLKFLQDGAPLPLTSNSKANPYPKETEAITLIICPTGAFMVQSGEAGDAVNAIPLLSRDKDSKLKPVIPGSSLKGVLRSVAMRIVNTLDRDVTLVTALFGGKRENEGPNGRAALSVPDVYAKSGPEKPQHWLYPRQDCKSKALPHMYDAANYPVAAHIAVDRWTGGVAGSKLFSEIEPWGLEFEDAKLTLDLERLANALRGGPSAAIPEAAKALLYLTLREMKSACPALGHGSTRGYGTISAEHDYAQTPEMQAAWTAYLAAPRDMRPASA